MKIRFSELIIKQPLLWVIKGCFFGFENPQQQVDMHARSKNTFIFIFYKYNSEIQGH